MSYTPDQIPRLKVNYELAIPAGETSSRPTTLGIRDEANIRWDKTFDDFDIWVDGKWDRLVNRLKLYEVFMTRAEYYDHDMMTYMLALHEDINNLYIEVQEIRKLLGQDLMKVSLT